MPEILYFLFFAQVVLFQLCDVTLMVMVYKKTLKKKQRIGWFTLGRTSSGEEESAHWKEMEQCNGDQLSRWHVLIESWKSCKIIPTFLCTSIIILFISLIHLRVCLPNIHLNVKSQVKCTISISQNSTII